MIFDINKYKKFKNKIIYHVVDDLPKNIEPILGEDNEDNKADKLINNSVKRENYQREMAQKYLKDLQPDDIILINDS